MRLCRVSFACLLLCTLLGATPALAGRAPAPKPKPAETSGLDADRLAGFKARSIGPAGMSGRVAAIDATASDPQTVYVGAATGGLWRSSDGGVTWEPLFDDQPVHSIGAVAVSPANPSVVWVGTGEGNVRNSTSFGNGVYRSLDGGRTWQHLGLERTERIEPIVLDPGDPDVAYVCALGQEWGENPERGVFKTEDGGKSWKKVLYVDEKTGCGGLVMDPTNPRKLFASLWQFRRWPWSFASGGPGSGFYVTYDAGATWKRYQPEDGLPEGDLGRVGIAVSRSNPEIVYALVEAKKSALLRSSDGGKSWKTVNDKPGVAQRPFYFGNIRVDPAWPNRVYSLDFDVRVSDDGGKSFSSLPGGADIHGDYHALWIDPADPTHLYIGDDGGIAESRDRGKTFRFIHNLPLAQFYHVAVDDDVPYHVYGGLQDNGSWRGPSTVWQDGGIRNDDWESVGFGDGFDCRPDPRDSTRGYSLWQGGGLLRWSLATGEIRPIKPAEPPDVKLRFNWNAGFAIDPFEPDTIYLGSQFLHRSRDRGATWETISPDLTTNDKDWQKQDESGGLTPDVSGAESFTTIVAIAPSPLARGLIWVGTDDGRVQVTRDGGASWTAVEKNLPGVPANTWVPHILPSRFDAGTAYAVFDNHRRSDLKPYVAVTHDDGATWTSLVTPDLAGYCLSIEQDTVDKDLLFLGTELGLYVSRDGGKAWTHLAKTLPTASVMDLALQPRQGDLVIATHGRALFVLDDVAPLRDLSPATLAEPLHLFPVAAAQQHWNKGEAGGFGFGASEFRGKNRPYGAILTYWLDLPGLPLQDEEKERVRKQEERVRQAQAAAMKPAAAATGAQPGAAPQAAAGETAAAPGEKEETGETPLKVEIRVADAEGKTVRNFKAPARLGINRAVWDLARDGFKELPRGEDEPPPQEGENRGPEVPPGSYTVTVSYAGHEAQQAVEVLADPRSGNTPADWQARWQAITTAGNLFDATVDAVWRIRRTRDDVDVIEQKLRQRARDAGETDAKKIEQQPLIQDGDKLKEALTGLEKRLWQPPEVSGIVAPNQVLQRIYEALGTLTSSWEPPTPTDRQRLSRAQGDLDGFLAELGRSFDKEVADYRRKVQAAGVSLLGATPAPAPGPLPGGTGG